MRSQGERAWGPGGEQTCPVPPHCPSGYSLGCLVTGKREEPQGEQAKRARLQAWGD